MKRHFIAWILCLFILIAVGLASDASDPSDKDTIAQANSLMRAGNTGQAVSLLQSASQANPQSVLLHEALGELFFGQRKYEDAVRELTLALQIDPNSRQYSMLLASALISWTHFGVAVDFLNAAEPRLGQFADFHYYKGIALLNMNRVDEAKPEFEQTTRLEPNFDRAQFLLAKCLVLQGKGADALPIYRKLVKQKPDNVFYWATLAETLDKLGTGNDEALQAGRRAIALAPENQLALFTTANILGRMGDFTSAVPLLEKLTRIDPTAIAAHAALARAYTRLNQRVLARKQKEIVEKLQAQMAPQSSPTTPQ